jgi:hypothetical protein
MRYVNFSPLTILLSEGGLMNQELLPVDAPLLLDGAASVYIRVRLGISSREGDLDYKFPRQEKAWEGKM